MLADESIVLRFPHRERAGEPDLDGDTDEHRRAGRQEPYEDRRPVGPEHVRDDQAAERAERDRDADR